MIQSEKYRKGKEKLKIVFSSNKEEKHLKLTLIGAHFFNETKNVGLKVLLLASFHSDFKNYYFQ